MTTKKDIEGALWRGADTFRDTIDAQTTCLKNMKV